MRACVHALNDIGCDRNRIHMIEIAISGKKDEVKKDKGKGESCACKAVDAFGVVANPNIQYVPPIIGLQKKERGRY